ncbi:MAG TPA: amidohydrolase/deacetylase family metallohydrolase, partial [Rugosimonospora sp.]|nr:amidohydrolase/deacetylase family metallohydrolase [Rugosimonospora sp.]
MTGSTAGTEPAYDLLLAGGEVLDPGAGVDGRYDIGVRAGRIAAIAPDLPRDAAREVVDVAGMLVSPGLVDLHTHVYPGATYWGIDPDPVAWYTGVTTWVDAGSAGAYTLDGLRAAARGYGVRVAALLNVSGIGLTGPQGECRDLSMCDVDVATAALLANRDLLAGVKVRLDARTVGEHGLEPLRRALAVAGAAGVPVMVHIGTAPPTVDSLLPLLRPGDIVTHCASGLATGITGPDGVTPAVRDAYAKGVRFDIGHGSGGFAFDVLEAQLAAGIVPYTVSTDLHARSQYGPVFDLPTTMAKLLAAGLSLAQVVAATTAHPATVLGLPGGTLAVGAPADIAVFRVEPGDFTVADAHRQRRVAPLRLVNQATYVAGRP